ncbi:hypothetical protein [Gordonia sp. (in: high G+C Gram-positive bacteria)]|uniref:hypothetical protein n=1 Tax=Gordonia sp. (in: high G+C Gram-positive bacteria) TaxID=84139 RepID=UPI0035279998
MASALCVCGHDRAAHAHYRDGTDCSLCADGSCPRFRSSSGLRGLLSKVLGK